MRKFGLIPIQNDSCCQKEFADELEKYGKTFEEVIDRRKSCGICGAGVNGYIAYRGNLINPIQAS